MKKTLNGQPPFVKTERALLEDARERIRDGQNIYICLALSKSAESLAYGNPEREVEIWFFTRRLQRGIGYLLGAHSTLEGWQIRHLNRLEDPDRARADRIAWINYWLANW